jgi:hypothetical protein
MKEKTTAVIIALLIYGFAIVGFSKFIIGFVNFLIWLI